MTKSTRPKVFVSYAQSDRKSVEVLVDTLKEHGLDIWTDSDIAPGQDWQQEIEKALDQASVFLLVLSADAMASPWQNMELGMALRSAVGQSKKRVIPVLLRGADRTAMPPFLKNRAAIELDPADYRQAVESIAEVVATSDT